MSFVHLHQHSDRSYLDGIALAADIARAAAADGQPATAITDHGSLAGVPSFADAVRAQGVKPIVGCEFYLAIGDRHEHNIERVPRIDGADTDPDADGDTEIKTKRKVYEHITVLAVNETGWRNLVRLNNLAALTYFYKPRIDLDLLCEHNEGLVVLTGCLGGPVAGRLLAGQRDVAHSNLAKLVDGFGSDRCFVEIMDHGIPAEAKIVPELFALASEFGLRCVATNDNHYVSPGEAEAHDVWLCVQQNNRSITDPTRFRFNGSGFHMRTADEMRTVWSGVDGARGAGRNTLLVAEMCDDDVFGDTSMKLPRFPVPDGYATNAAYLRELVIEGAKSRWGDPYPAEIAERLKVEFKTIKEFDVVDYFLIAWDLVTAARGKGFQMGFGRGSAAGCAISYCLGITGVDPIANDLLFERFLNPTRKSMPDIDLDFEIRARPWAHTYLQQRYGIDSVALLGTSGMARSKAAIRSVGRVLNLNDEADALARLVPMDGATPIPLAVLLAPGNCDGEAFRALMGSDDDHRRIVEISAAIEGRASNRSIHACGVVIGAQPLVDQIPMRKAKLSDPTTHWVTEFSGPEVEAAGFLKLDVLGLRNLDVISDAVRQIERDLGIEIDADNICADPGDPHVVATWRMLAEGRTAGVFQLESPGMTQLCIDMAPTSLHHLAALVALYRPGPLGAGMHQRYADRKTGREEVDYSIFTTDRSEIDLIGSVLDVTYGVPVYQEQLMQLGSVVAGFDPAWTNRLQKAVSKKIRDEMILVGEAFIEGSTDRGVKLSTAQRLWEAIRGAADYAFNRSHSYGYGQAAYVTAYLKANYPAQYGAAILSNTRKDDKRYAAILALRGEGVEVLPPSINDGMSATVTQGLTVRLGMGEVKGVGAAAEDIDTARENGGRFTSLHDLLRRSGVGVGVVQALIEAGALDEIGPRMGLTMAVRAAKDCADTPVFDCEWGALERSKRERQRLGTIFSAHPLTELSPQISAWRDSDLTDASGRPIGRKATAVHRLDPESTGDILTIGVLSTWKEVNTASGSRANFEVEGSKASVSGVAWDRTVTKMRAAGIAVNVGDVVAVRGKMKRRTVWREDPETGDQTAEEVIELVAWGITKVHVIDPPTVSWTINGAEPEAPPAPVLTLVEPRSTENTLVELW